MGRPGRARAHRQLGDLLGDRGRLVLLGEVLAFEHVICQVPRASLDASGDLGAATALRWRWGFRSAAHFSRAFEARYGITPSACRRSKIAGTAGPLGAG